MWKHWPNMYFNRCEVQKTDYVMIITDRGRKLNFVWLKLLFGLQGRTEIELAGLLRIVQFEVET